MTDYDTVCQNGYVEFIRAYDIRPIIWSLKQQTRILENIGISKNTKLPSVDIILQHYRLYYILYNIPLRVYFIRYFNEIFYI